MTLDLTRIIYGNLTSEIVFNSEKDASNVESFVETIIKIQRWEIDKISTSSKMNQSISAHLKNNYASIPLMNNKMPLEGDFSSFIINETQKRQGSLVFCIGDSGCGKSTLLIKTFLDIPKLVKKIIPIYINLNNATEFSCDRKLILRAICERYKITLRKNLLNHLLNNYRFVFFLDGLDEKSITLKFSDIEKSIKSRTDDTFVISCRSHLYHQLKIDGFDSLIEFSPINSDLGIKYLTAYFFDAPEIRQKIREISGTIFDSHRNSIFSNILMLTLLAIHMKESSEYLLTFNKRRGTIMDSIATALIDREIKKNNFDLSTEMGCEIIEATAIYTYERHQNEKSYIYDLMLQSIRRQKRKVEPDLIERIINIYASKSGDTKTYRFFHAQFYDFFVAKAFFNAIKRNQNIDKYLNYTFSVDINALLSDLMRDDDASSMIYKKLEGKCKKYINITTVVDNNEDVNYGRLFLLMMHMQRTGEYAQLYKFAQTLLGSGETYPPDVDTLLLHSKIIGGLKEEDEELYFYKLNTDEGFKARHMGTPLLYYNEELEFKLPHYDNGAHKYRSVFYAYSRHFLKSETIKHYYIVRRHNFFTIRNLLEKRNQTPIEVADFYSSIKADVEKDRSQFGLKVKAEYDLLMEAINKYPLTSDDY